MIAASGNPHIEGGAEPWLSSTFRAADSRPCPPDAMALHRLYHPSLAHDAADPGNLLEISGAEAHHAASVKRVGRGDEVEVFDGRGLVAAGRIESVGRRIVTVKVEAVRRVDPPRPAIIVAAPPPKGARAEGMIDQLSQVGAARYVPLLCQRRIAEPRETRVTKWREATAVESAKQCGRAWVLEIDEPTPLADALRAWRDALLLVGDFRGEPACEALRAAAAARCVALFIGPEGGFTGAEQEAIRAAGAAAVTFGRHLLRVETAAVVGAAVMIAALQAAP